MDKKLLVAMLLSLATVMALQYFQKDSGPVAAQAGMLIDQKHPGFRVPSPDEMLAAKLSSEVDFIDQKITQQEQLVSVTTDLATYEFSTYGGALASVVYNQRLGKGGAPLRTVQHKDFFHRDETCFLLALQEQTPFYYKLDAQRDEGTFHELVYSAESNNWVITKTYRVYTKTYQIDLALSFAPKGSAASPLQARLFFPAPYLAELGDDKITGFAYDAASQSIETGDTTMQSKRYKDIFGSEDRYFAHTMVADSDAFVRYAYYKFNESKSSAHAQDAVLSSDPITEKTTYNLAFYVGPKDIHDLALVDARLEGLLNFGWLSWLCKWLLQLLEWLYAFIGNYGLAIMVLTFLIKLPLVPLSIKSARTMEEYQKYQPQINHLRQKYRHDLKQQQEAIMQFHRERNISPAAPMMGCLPLIIDLPIMFALYKVLGNYMDLYMAPFVGWIVDLSSKDPYYVLPVLMGVSMVWQQRLSPIGDDRQKVMMYVMAIVMTMVFSNFAAGLVLYWLTKNVLTVGETYLRRAIFRKA